MTDAVEIIAKALTADSIALRTLAQNIANAQTPGYQRAVPIAREFAALAQTDTPDSGPHVQQVRTETDRTPGTLRQTDAELDLAVDGAGYFVVEATDGVALTRRGDFRRDAAGFVITFDGSRLLGLRGPVQVGAGKVQITTAGDVKVDGREVDRLRIARLEPEAESHSSASGLLITHSDDLREVGDAIVRQGYLEGSNVESVNEMLRVMETLRHFEAMQRYFRVTDDLTQKAISELGKTGY